MGRKNENKESSVTFIELLLPEANDYLEIQHLHLDPYKLASHSYLLIYLNFRQQKKKIFRHVME